MRKPSSKDQANLKSSQKSDLTKSPKSEGGKKPDLRARYWKFLFDNLQRAVDAIYETCEQDESALECKVKAEQCTDFATFVVVGTFKNKLVYTGLQPIKQHIVSYVTYFEPTCNNFCIFLQTQHYVLWYAIILKILPLKWFRVEMIK